MEVSSTSSTRHRRLRRCSATSPDQALTSAFTDGQLTPWRRTTARIVITCASATRRCARRRVSRPSNSGCPSSHRLSQPPHTNRRRTHTSVVRRPDTSRSRTARSRVSCTLWHLNPQCGQRGRLTVDSTRTLNSSAVSTTTASTRTWRRCSRTRITSEAIGALLDRDHVNHRFQQGPDPCSGTLNHPAPHVPAQAHKQQPAHTPLRGVCELAPTAFASLLRDSHFECFPTGSELD